VASHQSRQSGDAGGGHRLSDVHRRVTLAFGRSALFSGTTIPVVAWFSLGGGSPEVPDAAPAPRGMALELHLPGGALADQCHVCPIRRVPSSASGQDGQAPGAGVAQLFLLGARRRFAGGDRGPVEITLGLITLQRAQCGGLFLAFDALRSNLKL
jgi:hypothetical protein